MKFISYFNTEKASFSKSKIKDSNLSIKIKNKNKSNKKSNSINNNQNKESKSNSFLNRPKMNKKDYNNFYNSIYSDYVQITI